MTENLNQPQADDAVLGNQALPPSGSLVLGGLDGIKQRFPHYSVEQKIATLLEVTKYGQPGLDLVIQALADASELVQLNAYSILKERAQPRIKQVLQEQLTLNSLVEMDCTQLGGLLAVGRWQEADRETTAMMLRVVGRETSGLLKLADIERLPRAFLQKIDQLWWGCSEGNFGLNVQKQIWQTVGGKADANYQTWYRFCEQVGWRVNNCWVEYPQFTFGLGAPQGHLPFLAVGGYGVVVCLHNLFSRLEN
ncbi:MAG: GUN4 domain-containing protein [Symploca sp. SIO2E6]|nr:GUN4 domain-containing protein [Symploca sp. SIO2E6]